MPGAAGMTAAVARIMTPWLTKKKVVDPILSREQMFVLVLHTGCDANLDMCAAERNCDFDKWRGSRGC